LFRCWIVLIPDDDIEGDDKKENPWDVLRDNSVINVIIIIVMDSVISL
jgi:hypothetical protein